MLLIVLGVDITFDSACAQALTFSFSRLAVLLAKMVSDIVRRASRGGRLRTRQP